MDRKDFVHQDIPALLALQQQLQDKAPSELAPGMDAQITAGLGLIEEVLEYLSSIGRKPWRPIPQPENERLEELTDILFYYLEAVNLSGFSWEQIAQEYWRKWQVNMKRYEDGAKGDFSWDKRLQEGEKQL